MKSLFCKMCILIISSILFGCTPQERHCLPTYFECKEECGNTRQCEQGCALVYEECASTEYTFPIHYVIATSNANNLAENDLRAEVDTLNKYFRAFDTRFPDHKRKIVHFEYRSTTFLNSIQNLNNPLINFLQSEHDHISLADTFEALFIVETNQLIRDSTAINIYIYDNWTTDLDGTGVVKGFGGMHSHGRSSSNNPYNLIDFLRLGHVYGVEEHEIGHCFDLPHICDSTAVTGSPTNIMTAGGDSCPGLAIGDRSIGFTEAQVQAILLRAPSIVSELND